MQFDFAHDQLIAATAFLERQPSYDSFARLDPRLGENQIPEIVYLRAIREEDKKCVDILFLVVTPLQATFY